jgi:hypothetical protein
MKKMVLVLLLVFAVLSGVSAQVYFGDWLDMVVDFKSSENILDIFGLGYSGGVYFRGTNWGTFANVRTHGFTDLSFGLLAEYNVLTFLEIGFGGGGILRDGSMTPYGRVSTFGTLFGVARAGIDFEYRFMQSGEEPAYLVSFVASLPIGSFIPRLRNMHSHYRTDRRLTGTWVYENPEDGAKIVFVFSGNKVRWQYISQGSVVIDETGWYSLLRESRLNKFGDVIMVNWSSDNLDIQNEFGYSVSDSSLTLDFSFEEKARTIYVGQMRSAFSRYTFDASGLGDIYTGSEKTNTFADVLRIIEDPKTSQADRIALTNLLRQAINRNPAVTPADRATMTTYLDGIHIQGNIPATGPRGETTLRRQ